MSHAVASPSEFPSWPVGWYLAARSRDVPAGRSIARTLAGRDLVVFRQRDRRLAATDAHCPHMGTHLRHGRVEGDAIVCPMHHWKIAASGEVRTADGRACGEIRTWIVEERCGLIYVWLGPSDADDTTPGPLPVPDDVDDFRWRSGGAVKVETPWHALIVSAYDMDHLAAVHNRRLISGPEIETLDDGRLRLSYVSRVDGGGLVDRAMAWLGRDGISVQMTCGGSNLVVETTMGGRRTGAILGLLPIGPTDERGASRGVHAYGSFGVTRDRWMKALQLRVANWLFLGFLRKDFAIIEDIRLRTQVQDAGVRAMCSFLAGIPDAHRDASEDASCDA